MKTIEEKAKRYDEAIKVAKSNYETIVQMDNDCTFAKEGIVNTFHHIFPELKESEDERIRKTLISHFCGIRDNCGKDWYGFNINDVIAWLEKQGEQKYIPKYKIGDYVKNTNYKGEPIYEIVYMDKECYICEYRGKERMGDKAVMHFSFDNPYLRLVQKPTDAWSEKDEHWRQKAIDFMKHPDLIKATPTLAKDTIDWLKSLRPQL